MSRVSELYEVGDKVSKYFDQRYQDFGYEKMFQDKFNNNIDKCNIYFGDDNIDNACNNYFDNICDNCFD